MIPAIRGILILKISHSKKVRALLMPKLFLLVPEIVIYKTSVPYARHNNVFGTRAGWGGYHICNCPMEWEMLPCSADDSAVHHRTNGSNLVRASHINPSRPLFDQITI